MWDRNGTLRDSTCGLKSYVFQGFVSATTKARKWIYTRKTSEKFFRNLQRNWRFLCRKHETWRANSEVIKRFEYFGSGWTGTPRMRIKRRCIILSYKRLTYHNRWISKHIHHLLNMRFWIFSELSSQRWIIRNPANSLNPVLWQRKQDLASPKLRKLKDYDSCLKNKPESTGR